jgi:hypothetical protein
VEGKTKEKTKNIKQIKEFVDRFLELTIIFIFVGQFTFQFVATTPPPPPPTDKMTPVCSVIATTVVSFLLFAVVATATVHGYVPTAFVSRTGTRTTSTSSVSSYRTNHLSCRSYSNSKQILQQATHRTVANTQLHSSQWDDDDEEDGGETSSQVTASTSFDEAGKSLAQQDDDEKMAKMGNFDANPSVR